MLTAYMPKFTLHTQCGDMLHTYTRDDRVGQSAIKSYERCALLQTRLRDSLDGGRNLSRRKIREQGERVDLERNSPVDAQPKAIGFGIAPGTAVRTARIIPFPCPALSEMVAQSTPVDPRGVIVASEASFAVSAHG